VKSFLRFLVLPIQAPMLLVLVAVSTYLGLHWSDPLEASESKLAALATLVWSVECAQALAVVLICTMPLMLVRQVSSLMATSRVLSLVTVLLLVTVGGLYLLHLDVLANVLILGASVLLARLDLVRIQVVPAPAVMAVVFSLIVLAGASFGRVIAFWWMTSR
jgi:hypothetical protein